MNILEIENQYSWLKTDDDEIKTLLWKLLRCRARNYYHNFRYKIRAWDGFDEYFKKDSGRFLTGLLPEVHLVLRKKGIEYEVVDNRGEFQWGVEEINSSFLNDGPNPVKELRDYQVDYVNQVIKNWRGLITAATGAGKAQPLDSKVYTPIGPINMGDLKIGDQVCVPSGKVANIIGVFPQGEKDIYKINFSNGDSVECCDEHIWKVNAVMSRWSGRIKNTKYLRNHLITPAGRPRYYIDLPKIVTFNERFVKIDPYLMGLLLGDGGLSRKNVTRFTNADKQIIDSFNFLLNNNYTLKHIENYDYMIIKKNNTKGKTNIYNEAIRFYKLSGCRSHEKFIPDDYKYNTPEIRLAVLQGLFDTDGWVNKRGYIELPLSSKKLISDAKEIIESLGGMCRIREKQPYYTYKGQKKKGKICYTLSVVFPEPSNLFQLKFKKSRCRNIRKSMNTRIIKEIKCIGKKQCQCILIDDPEHLYLTNHMVPTHNTNSMKAIIKALKPKTPTLILANRKSLVDQNYDEVKSMGIEWVGRLYGEEKEPNYITCATIQSAHLLKPILPKIKVLIVDEVHEMMSKIPKKIYNSLKNCCVRVGMSATVFKFGGKDASQKFEVKGYFGPVFLTKSTEDGKLTTKELIDREILSTAECTFYRITEPKIPYEIYLDAVTKGIAENDYFHKKIAQLVKSFTGRTLIIVERLEHGDRLHDLIPGSLWVRGQDSLETRKIIIDKLKNDKGDVVGIASSIFNTGINVFVNQLVNAAGGQADHQIIQKFGRGLRRTKDKKHLKYFDFFFEINEYLQKHSEKRISILKKEGHSVVIKDDID